MLQRSWKAGREPWGCGAWLTLDFTVVWCRSESIKHMLLEGGSGSFSCCRKPADCGYGSTFPSCVVCGHSALVVFPIVFTEVRLDIMIFTWMTDHTNVMIVFGCVASTLLYSAPLCLFVFVVKSHCYQIQQPPQRHLFQIAAASSSSLPERVWPPCISSFTGNYSLGRLKSNVLFQLTDHHYRAGLPGILSIGLNFLSSFLLKISKYSLFHLKLIFVLWL